MTATTLVASDQAESRVNLYKTIAYYLTFIALGLGGVTLGPTLHGLASHTATTISQISLVFSARALGYMAGSYIGGRVV